MATSGSSALVRQNFHGECEQALNNQIHQELQAMYTYISMASHFQKSDRALEGFSSYFKKAAEEEMCHVSLLAKYQNKRGGRVQYKTIPQPEKEDWGSGLDAMQSALKMERNGNETLLALHQLADKHNDYDFANFLEEHFLEEAVATIKELGDHVTNLQRVKPGHGEYHYDKHLSSQS